MESRYDDRGCKTKTRNVIMGLNIEKIRSEFPIFSNVKDIIYFDNASTTHKPKIVIKIKAK